MSSWIRRFLAALLAVGSSVVAAQTPPGDARGRESTGTVTVHPAPAEEEMSDRFTVQAQGLEVPVYALKVASGDPTRRWRAMDDKKNSGDYFDPAAFASFDFRGTVTITVTAQQEIRSARILPSSFQLQPKIAGRRLTFTLTEPRNLTIEVNGDAIGSLHLFANPPETNVPRPDDPNVIYFGPGIHEVSRLVVKSHQTVYVAGGAVVRGVVKPEEKYTISSYSGLRSYAPTVELNGNHITVRGRGIIDGSLCPTHARNLMLVRGQDILIEGVILRDASTWNIPIRQSDRVTVRNVKILGRRANSDGIDICNSRDVTVDGCFLRTLDDLIVVKADKGKGEVHRILAKDCVLWNEVAHALSVGAELREAVDDVRFVNCDVIHDKGREWTLRVYHCDAARISNVRFENIRVEESRRLISLWIGKATWSRDEARGQVRGVTFSHLRAAADPGKVELKGFDADHQIEDVTFQDVVVNGRPLGRGDVTSNPFVRNVAVQP